MTAKTITSMGVASSTGCILTRSGHRIKASFPPLSSLLPFQWSSSILRVPDHFPSNPHPHHPLPPTLPISPYLPSPCFANPSSDLCPPPTAPSSPGLSLPSLLECPKVILVHPGPAVPPRGTSLPSLPPVSLRS